MSVSLMLIFPLPCTVNTHCHADHITGTGLLKKKVFGLKSAISKFSGATADILLSEGDNITFGKHVRTHVILRGLGQAQYIALTMSHVAH